MRPYVYPVLLLLLVSLTTAMYYLAYPGVDINADTPTYLSAADRLFTHPYQLLDPVRLPGYPLFIVLIYAIAGRHNLAAVGYVQGVLFIVTALEIYLLALRLFRRPLLACIVALLFGTNPTLLGYSKAIMSEGLAALLLTSLALVVVTFIQTPSRKVLWLITGLLLLLIFTRPEWLLLPLPLFALLCLPILRDKRRQHKPFLYIGAILVSLVLIYGSLAIYSQQNAQRNHYAGLTAVSSWNYMGKVLQYNMQDEVPVEQRPLSRKLDACIARIDRDPFHVLPCVPELANDQYDSAAGSFALSIIVRHPGEFVLKSLPLFVSSLVDYHDVTYHIHAAPGVSRTPLARLQALQRALYWVNICFPLCIVSWLLYSGRRAWARLSRRRELRRMAGGAGDNADLYAVKAASWHTGSVEQPGRDDGRLLMLAAIGLLVGYGVLVTTLAGYRPDDYMRFHIVFDQLLILFVWGSILDVVFALKCCNRF